MYKNFKLVTFMVNMSDNASETIEHFDNERVALDKFYDKLSLVGGNPQTKSLKVMLFDETGEMMRNDERDNSKYIEPTVTE